MRLALTVRQPWAWAIVSGHKDVENRTWKTDHRGPLLIHAAVHHDPAGWVALNHQRIAAPERLTHGAVIGSAYLLDVVRDADSPWALDGYWHWVLAHPRTFVRPQPCRGARGRLFVPQTGGRKG